MKQELSEVFGEWVSEWAGMSYLGSVYLLQRKQRK